MPGTPARAGELVPGLISINVWTDGEHLSVDAYRVYTGTAVDGTSPPEEVTERYYAEDTSRLVATVRWPSDLVDRVVDGWYDVDAHGIQGSGVMLKEFPDLAEHLDRIRAAAGLLYAFGTEVGGPGHGA